MDLNNREIAALIWIAVLIGILLVTARSSVKNVLRAALSKYILTSFLMLTLYTCGLAWLGAKLHIWNTELLKETIIWFVGSALVLLFNLTKAMNEEGFFRRAALRTLQVTVAVEFLLNLDIAVLPLFAELILQPVVALLVGASVLATHQQQVGAKRLIEAIVALIGVGVIAYSGVRIGQNLRNLEWHTEVLQFALPVWMTAGILPLVYFFSSYAAYELLFIRIDFFAKSHEQKRRAKMSAVRLGIRPRTISRFAGPWVTKLVLAESKLERRNLIGQYKKNQQGQGGRTSRGRTLSE